MRNIFLEKLYTKCAGETIPRPFSKKSKLSISIDQQSKDSYSLFLMYAELRATEIYSNEILFRSGVILFKPGFCEYVETRYFLFWQVSQDLNKIKKVSNTLLQTLVSREHVQNFHYLLKSMVVRARQSFQFQFFQIKYLVSRKQVIFV